MLNEYKIQSEYFDIGNQMPLFHTLYAPTNNTAKATILIIHGMQEHSGRYNELSVFLVKNGFVVLTYDQPGHGRTAKTMSDLGFFRKQKPHEMLMESAEAMATHLHAQYPMVPHMVLAHSMGTFVVRSLLQTKPQLFDAAILIGTGSRVMGVRGAQLYFALRNIIWPKRKTLFNKTFKAINNRRFKNEKGSNGIGWLSLNKANRDAFENDELCGVDFSVNGFYGLFTINLMATNNKWSEKLDPQMPVLLMSGANDPIGDFGKGVKQTYNNMLKNGMKQVKLKLYPNLRHEILRELNNKAIYNDLLKWLEQSL